MKANRRKIIIFLMTLLLMGLTAVAVTAASDPNQITFTLEGCNLDHGASYDDVNILCSDDGYTTGNLGKSWSELDLVPHRITARNDNGNQTYSIIVAGDYKAKASDTFVGWDFISELTLNATLSDATCTAPTTGSLTTTPSGSGAGGADQTIYRLVTIAQQAGDTCVYDYYQRLAVGAHNFSGSSLQSNLWNQNLQTSGVGQKRIQLPVAEIAPQEISKDMSAIQDADHVWNITKAPTPASLNFANTCLADPSNREQNLSITIEWEKLPASLNGDILVTTNVYATNPSHRTIRVEVEDEIRTGTTVLDTATLGPEDISPNTIALVGTHQFIVPDGTTNLNDVATATYTDVLTGEPVPGQTVALASATVQPSGATLNQSATIKDIESITGTNLSYSTDSFSGATGGFDLGYIAGTITKGSVSWTSASQSDNGSVTLYKTVYVDQPAETSGTLSDTANLTGSDGFTASANASVDIDTFALVDLTINKNIPGVLQTGESVTFNFNVIDSQSNIVATPSITFNAGDASKSVTVTGLEPGQYTVHEIPLSDWNAQIDQVVDIDLPTCSNSVTFSNDFPRAQAKVKKVTDPAGEEAGWEFTLNGPGGPVTATTTGTGFVTFSTVLQEGSYTISETSKPGWDQTGTSGDCSFTVDYPADSGKVFECTFNNRLKRGHILIDKVTDPNGSLQSFEFNPSYGSNFFLTDSAAPNDSGELLPGAYSVAEVNIPSDWDLTDSYCQTIAGTGTSTDSPAAITLEPGETVKCTFEDTQRGKIIVDKVTFPTGSSQQFEFDPSWSSTNFLLADADTPADSGFLAPSSYSVAEVNIPSDWDLTDSYCQTIAGTGTSTDSPAAITLEPGETVKCTFEDTQRGMVQVNKTVSGGPIPDDGTSFTFEIRENASLDAIGDIIATDTIAYPDTGTNFGGLKMEPGEYQLCEKDMLPGWHSSLSDMSGAFVPGGNLPDPDNSVVCVPFTLDPGETESFSIDNTPPPGGDARTIGFWKNWTSCDGHGNQDAVLDEVLATFPIASGESTHGVYIGDLYVDTCANAVDILNKSPIGDPGVVGDGDKSANDAAYGLAAQLLAAELNIQANAGSCPAASDAISAGQTRLVDLGFDGNGEYLSPQAIKGGGKPAKELRADTEDLAHTLDLYNNNLLCP
ncbi:MAG: hypothetical protein P8Y03_24695 [Anaerolineales bacterium]